MHLPWSANKCVHRSGLIPFPSSCQSSCFRWKTRHMSSFIFHEQAGLLPLLTSLACVWISVFYMTKKIDLFLIKIAFFLFVSLRYKMSGNNILQQTSKKTLFVKKCRNSVVPSFPDNLDNLNFHLRKISFSRVDPAWAKVLNAFYFT